MQDRYAGDVGDFEKLGILRQIATTGLKIGVNWYLHISLKNTTTMMVSMSNI